MKKEAINLEENKERFKRGFEGGEKGKGEMLLKEGLSLTWKCGDVTCLAHQLFLRLQSDACPALRLPAVALESGIRTHPVLMRVL